MAKLSFWLFLLEFVLIYYVNSQVLIPQLFFKKRYLLWGACIASIFMAVAVLKPVDHLISENVLRNPQGPPPMERFEDGPPRDIPEHRRPPVGGPGGPGKEREGPVFDILSLVICAMVIAAGLTVKVGERWRLSEQRAARAEADKANAELSFLKAQINPHFLFNTLNNIYSLAVTNNANTADCIMKLSNIMRYVTDEAGEQYVPLQNELDCITNYTDLQRLRLSRKTSLEYEITGFVDMQQIAPLILMPFIENTFKHGVSNHDASEIIIRIDIKENSLQFFSQNKIFNGAKEGRNGIGISNTQKRLVHLYSGAHTLKIDAAGDIYTVWLKMDLTLKNQPLRKLEAV